MPRPETGLLCIRTECKKEGRRKGQGVRGGGGGGRGQREQRERRKEGSRAQGPVAGKSE